jgi:hypothetical protein
MAGILDHRRNPNAMLAPAIAVRLGVSTGGQCYGIVGLTTCTRGAGVRKRGSSVLPAGQAGVRVAVAQAGDPRTQSAVGLLGSIALHGLLLVPFLFMLDGPAITQVIPIDVVLIGNEAEEPPPVPVAAPQEETEASAPLATAPPGSAPSNERPDEVELKLQRLAQTLQGGADARSATRDPNPARVAPMRGTGADGTYRVSDLVRAQVERRWGPDLAALGNRSFSVRIRVEMTGQGVVTRADVEPDPRFAGDPDYQAIARSARNAVLLSSPFTLPRSDYGDALAFTLNLNTADAVR